MSASTTIAAGLSSHAEITTSQWGGDLAHLLSLPAWEALVQDSGSLVSLLDGDGRWLFANEHTASFVGKPVSEIIGRTMSELLPEDFADERLNVLRRVLQTGQCVRVVTRLLGSRMECAYRPLRCSPTSPLLVLATGRLIPVAAGSAQASNGSRENGANTVELSTRESLKIDSLTPRECEVLRMVGEGLSTLQIAERLFRAVKTVEAHRASLGRKLGVTNRVQLALVAIQAGLVPRPNSENPLSARMSRANPPGQNGAGSR